MTEATKSRTWRREGQAVIDGSIKAEAAAYRAILELLARYPASFFGLLIVSILAALFEGLGIGVIIALMQEPQASIGAFGSISLLNSFGRWLSGMTFLVRVRFAAVALIAVVLLRGIFQYVSQIFSVLLQIRAEHDLRSQVFKQLLAVELRFTQRERMGTLFTILSNFPRQSGRLIQIVAGGFTHLFTTAVLVTLMILVSWQLTLVAMILLVGITAFLGRQLSLQIKRAGRKINNAVRQLNIVGTESLSAIKLIHLFSQEGRSIARFEAASDEYQASVYRRGTVVSLMRPLFSTMNAIVLGLLLIAGTLLFTEQIDEWIGLMVVFLAIVLRLMPPAAALNDVRAQVDSLHPALQNVLDFLYQESKPYLKNGHIRFSALKEGVALEGVTFCYDPRESPVLQNVTFDIPKGKTTAVVGASGAGKTTLVDLVARLYDCQEGHIRVDGIDLRDLDVASWRTRVAVVGQDTFIFNDTVLGNLQFARGDATLEQVYHAARLAQAHDFVMALPQGYDTVLGDRGVRLSGGQQQRIAIARAILVDPQLLIFDEATSDLDSEVERAIQTAIAQYSQGRTVLAIAHRLSTVRHADNIVVLDQGRVAEQGTHAELIRLRGCYWRLVQAQDLETVPGPTGGSKGMDLTESVAQVQPKSVQARDPGSMS